MNKAVNTLALSLSILACVSHVHAATKYAKVDGSTTANCDTWTNACTLGRAITLASSGDSVWVKKSVGNTPATDPYPPITLKNGVQIIGGFAGTETLVTQSNPATNVTVIDGGSAEQCVFGNSEGSTTVLRGFTIKNCNVGDDWDGGGGAVLNGSSALFVRCIFENNTATRFGAAVAIRGTGSPQFISCIFRNNGSATSGTGTDNNATPLAGGAIYLHSGTPQFVNCLFYGNKAGEGAGVALYGGTATFVNCTMVKNYAKIGYGGALHDLSGKAVLRNCVLWDNSAVKGGAQIFNTTISSTTATYSNINGGWAGTGNINSNPTFTNASSDDYTLQCSSPCRNAGIGSNPSLPDDLGDLDLDSNTSEPIPKDLANNARVAITVDIGAYERVENCLE